MVESPQQIYVHDRRVIEDDGEEKYEVSLNTRGETPPYAREAIYDEVYRAGVDPAVLHEEVDSDIGKVFFTDHDGVDYVELADWVVEQYGN
jgi:hypothetical protein